jgi:protein-tyrosine phosphatase
VVKTWKGIVFMPWVWSLNWGIITPELVVGTCPMVPADLEEIKKRTSVTAVLSLQHDECLERWSIDYDEMSRQGKDYGLVMERCPIRDFDPQDTRRCLPDAVRLLARLQAGGHRTYVHCTAGISRAPLIAFAYLTLVAGVAENTARKMILEGRPASVPYWEAYHGARADLAVRHVKQIERRVSELEDLGLSGDGTDAMRKAEAEVLRTVLSGS